jgi:hypothetical protein
MRYRACVDLLDTSCDSELAEDYALSLLKWHRDHVNTHPLLEHEKYLEHTSTKLEVEFHKHLQRELIWWMSE